MNKQTAVNGRVVRSEGRAASSVGGDGTTTRHYPEVTLPDGTTVFCVNKAEAKLIFQSVPGYFRHGIDIKDGDTVVDVGANIGLFTLAAHRRCHGNVTVYAFEPIPPVCNVLRMNAERLAGGRVVVLPYGLSGEDSTMSFEYFERATAWSSAYRDPSTRTMERQRIKRGVLAGIRHGEYASWLRFLPTPVRSLAVDLALRRMLEGTTVSCRVTTLSSVIEEHAIKAIDLLKLDAEKSELDVLRGIEERHWGLIRQIVLEVEEASVQYSAVAELLKTHGFKHITLDQNREQSAGDVGLVYASR
jgi:FkbM family methyltransferase